MIFARLRELGDVRGLGMVAMLVALSVCLILGLPLIQSLWKPTAQRRFVAAAYLISALVAHLLLLHVLVERFARVEAIGLSGELPSRAEWDFVLDSLVTFIEGAGVLALAFSLMAPLTVLALHHVFSPRNVSFLSVSVALLVTISMLAFHFVIWQIVREFFPAFGMNRPSAYEILNDAANTLSLSRALVPWVAFTGFLGCVVLVIRERAAGERLSWPVVAFAWLAFIGALFVRIRVQPLETAWCFPRPERNFFFPDPGHEVSKPAGCSASTASLHNADVISLTDDEVRLLMPFGYEASSLEELEAVARSRSWGGDWYLLVEPTVSARRVRAIIETIHKPEAERSSEFRGQIYVGAFFRERSYVIDHDRYVDRGNTCYSPLSQATIQALGASRGDSMTWAQALALNDPPDLIRFPLEL